MLLFLSRTKTFDVVCHIYKFQTVKFLTDQRDHEKLRKDALSNVFDETQKYVQSTKGLKGAAFQEIDRGFPNMLFKLNEEQLKMKDEVAPVLILGV